jgi:hypothetical protein
MLLVLDSGSFANYSSVEIDEQKAEKESESGRESEIVRE